MFLANTDGLWTFFMIVGSLLVIFGIAFLVSGKSKK
jgi:hypothetical protein